VLRRVAPKPSLPVATTSRRAVVLALGVAVCGCSAGPRPAEEGVGPSAPLKPGDWIKVTVYGEASLSGDFQIDQTGSVLLPLAGPTKAAGMIPTELADVLTKRYRTEYVRDPKVTVSGPRG
jgi:protein involved in polysaccharide export with SLBB domain